MKINYKDILNFLDEKPSLELLSQKLFQLGHEHEISNEVFDMDITPNRGDCLSLKGLARDLKIFFGSSKLPMIYEDDICELDLEFKNLSPTACPKISFIEVEVSDFTDKYKPYMEKYFSKLDNKKINFFTDISNYLSYEIGQPTHCYDRDKIKDSLVFEYRKCNNKFTTLSGSEISLEGKNCIFVNNENIISLAGVMGGMSTSCNQSTKKVLVECAYFNPELIIGKSVKYKLFSDAAHKFERGVDINNQELALRRFIKIVQDHAEISDIKIKSFSYNEPKKIRISKNYQTINKILGTNLSEPECTNYLKNLEFKISNDIEVPSFRHDVFTQNDIAEEIARLVGYDQISSKPIKLKQSLKNLDKKIKGLKNYLIHKGFNEVINFPFGQEINKASIKIDNPLDTNKNNLRLNLKNSLIENLLYNERRQKDSIKLFEISDIYKKNNSDISHEKVIGLIISGRLGNNYNDFTKKLDKKYLFKLFNATKNFAIEEISRVELDTKKNDPIFYLEIPVNQIIDHYEEYHRCAKNINFIKYNPISDFPSSNRDISFSVTKLEKYNELIKILDNTSDEIIKEKFIFDFFKDHKNQALKIGYRFIFQSKDKTLSDEDVNNKVSEIIKPIIELEGVFIPGMDI